MQSFFIKSVNKIVFFERVVSEVKIIIFACDMVEEKLAVSVENSAVEVHCSCVDKHWFCDSVKHIVSDPRAVRFDSSQFRDCRCDIHDCCRICHGLRRIIGYSFGVNQEWNSTVPLLPTQLISSAGDFAIFLFLLILFLKNKTRYPYFYFFAHALLYGVGRFTIEFYRIDPREFWGPLSMSQWMSLVLIIAGLLFFIKNRKEIVKSFTSPLTPLHNGEGNKKG